MAQKNGAGIRLRILTWRADGGCLGASDRREATLEHEGGECQRARGGKRCRHHKGVRLWEEALTLLFESDRVALWKRKGGFWNTDLSGKVGWVHPKSMTHEVSISLGMNTRTQAL